jgi:hypothetical protein
LLNGEVPFTCGDDAGTLISFDTVAVCARPATKAEEDRSRAQGKGRMTRLLFHCWASGAMAWAMFLIYTSFN